MPPKDEKAPPATASAAVAQAAESKTYPRLIKCSGGYAWIQHEATKDAISYPVSVRWSNGTEKFRSVEVLQIHRFDNKLLAEWQRFLESGMPRPVSIHVDKDSAMFTLPPPTHHFFYCCSVIEVRDRTIEYLNLLEMRKSTMVLAALLVSAFGIWLCLPPDPSFNQLFVSNHGILCDRGHRHAADEIAKHGHDGFEPHFRWPLPLWFWSLLTNEILSRYADAVVVACTYKIPPHQIEHFLLDAEGASVTWHLSFERLVKIPITNAFRREQEGTGGPLMARARIPTIAYFAVHSPYSHVQYEAAVWLANWRRPYHYVIGCFVIAAFLVCLGAKLSRKQGKRLAEQQTIL